MINILTLMRKHKNVAFQLKKKEISGKHKRNSENVSECTVMCVKGSLPADAIKEKFPHQEQRRKQLSFFIFCGQGRFQSDQMQTKYLLCQHREYKLSQRQFKVPC